MLIFPFRKNLTSKWKVLGAEPRAKVEGRKGWIPERAWKTEAHSADRCV